MTDNTAQKNSLAYRLAVFDTDFLLSDPMRGARLYLEYEKAEARLRDWGVRSTIVVFGSARVLPGGTPDENASTATLPPRAKPRPGSRSAFWYEQARQFGRIASELRLEAFNVLNHAQFANPNGQLGNAAFGTISAMLASPSCATCGTTERQIQLAVKLKF